MQVKVELRILMLALLLLTLPGMVVGQSPKVFFHVGNAQTAPAPWNNALSNPYMGTVFNDLKDDSGNNTGIKIELLTGWGGAYPSGVNTTNDSGLVPDLVLSEYYWFGLGISADEMHVRISGLMPGSNYAFKFVGASAYHGSGITDNGNTIYTIGAVSASLHVENNTTSAAVLNNIVPNAQGEVEAVITRASNAAAGYLNAIIIEMPGDALYTPSGLHASPQSGAMNVQWVDNNTTETGYDIFRANVIAGEDFQLIDSVTANSTTYTDNTVLDGFIYQYKIRAKNATRTSGFSSAYTATMPVSHGAPVTGTNHIYFDFGTSNTGPSPWNNAGRNPATGVTFSNILDQAGVNTGVSIELLTDWGGSYTDGATTGNNSGIVPDNVLKDYYWFGLFGSPNVVRFKIRGLTAGSPYNFRMVGSSVFRDAGVTDNGHTIYRIGTDSLSLDVEGNTANAAAFESVVANVQGEVIVTLEKGPDAMVGYINAMIIDLPTGMMYTPPGLKGAFAETTGVTLTWTDNNAAETGYEIYRRNATTNQAYSLLTTTAANVVSYIDGTVSQNAIYNYKIRAKNSTGGTSNFGQEIAARTTPVKRVYFNFGKTLAGPSPWNNASGDPQQGSSFKNLIDEFSVNTGLSIDLITSWGGANNAGATTGNNSGIVPDNVLQEFYWFAFLGSPEEVQFRISGLSPGKLYNFRIVGSSVFRYGSYTDNGNTIYSIGNTSVSLNVEGNTSASADFFDVLPDDNGQVTVRATKASNAFAGYINAIMMDLPKDMLYVPSNITAKYVAGSGINLNWIDNNTAETGYQIYRSTTPGTGYTLIATTAVNAVSYADGTVKEETLYYYKVRAVNAISVSSYSTETLIRANEVKRISFKFGKNYATPAHWNTAGADPVSGARFDHLQDEFGNDTGVSLKLLTAWGGLYSGGPTTGNNSGVVPDDVLQEYYWFGMFGAPEEVQFTVSGLDPSRTYNFKFLGSVIYHVSGVTDNGNTVYKIGDRSVSVAVENNTSRFGDLAEIVPDANGEVTVTVQKGVGAFAGYINALVIEMSKKLLYAPPVEARYTQGTGVSVSWVDNNATETGYEIYRSLTDENAYTLLTTAAASVTSYLDNTVAHGNTYFYKVRAISGSTASVKSRTAIVDCIDKNLVYFKFGKNLTVPAPWNNAAKDPGDGVVFPDLLDDEGNNSGVNIQLMGDWGGVYNQGVTTGNDSGIVPDNVLGEYYYFGFLSVTTEVKFKVSGLIPGVRYNFRFVGSSAFRGGGVTDNGSTVYSIGEESRSLYVEGNTSHYAEILNAVASTNGEVEVRLSKGQGAPVGYINALILEIPAGGPNFWAIADGDWSGAIWNTNKFATAGTHLAAESHVYIEGKTVTVTSDVAAQGIVISASTTAVGKLIVDGANLTNSGQLSLSENGGNQVRLINDGKILGTDQPVRIMPLGNSITQGNVSNMSYRYTLWKMLIDDNIAFDFVGSQSTNYQGNNPGYADYKGKTFDRDSEGHWGFRADELAAGLPVWLTGKMPDIALVHCGTNDMYQRQTVQSTADDIRNIIHILRSVNPSIKILLAKIIPMSPPAPADAVGIGVDILALNKQIQAISQEEDTQASPIYLVDQYSGFNVNTDLLVDGIHPNAKGENKMAKQWHEMLIQILQNQTPR
ncbi:MAG TPA: GDSL-type esterase/lipase family protein [Chryseolinea sp.]